MSALKNWYVEFPTYRYNEDVTALAQQGGLAIIDAALVPESAHVNVGDNLPALTLKAKYAPKKAVTVEPVKPAETPTPAKPAEKPKGADAIKAAEGG